MLLGVRIVDAWEKSLAIPCSSPAKFVLFLGSVVDRRADGFVRCQKIAPDLMCTVESERLGKDDVKGEEELV